MNQFKKIFNKCEQINAKYMIENAENEFIEMVMKSNHFNCIHKQIDNKLRNELWNILVKKMQIIYLINILEIHNWKN